MCEITKFINMTFKPNMKVYVYFLPNMIAYVFGSKTFSVEWFFEKKTFIFFILKIFTWNCAFNFDMK